MLNLLRRDNMFVTQCEVFCMIYKWKIESFAARIEIEMRIGNVF